MPAVGQNLQDHYLYTLFKYKLRPDLLQQIKSPLASLWSFHKCEESKDAPIEMEIMTHCPATPSELLSVYLVDVRSAIRGTVTLQNRDPLLPPHLTYFADPTQPENRDSLKMAKLFRKVRDWMLDSGLAVEEVVPSLNVVPRDATDEQILDFFGNLQGFSHPGSTCKMGPKDDPNAVVDPELRLRGASNVRVADCSIMPILVPTHPSGTATVIGEKLSGLIKAGW